MEIIDNEKYQKVRCPNTVDDDREISVHRDISRYKYRYLQQDIDICDTFTY